LNVIERKVIKLKGVSIWDRSIEKLYASLM
jgi:hypothetical protein